MSSLNFASQIAPKGLEFKSGEMVISDKYCTIMTVIGYPRAINRGYLSNLSQIGGVKIIIKHIPIQFSTLAKMLNKELADLKMKYANENDKTVQEKIRQDYETLESFITMLTATQARIFDFQMHLLIMADSKEELDNKKVQVKNYLDALGMRAVVLR